jgi:hypothetical protein
MSVVVFRGKGKRRLLFVPLLLVTACWDLGIFLVMIRNSYPDEIVLYQNAVTIPVLFYPVFAYHFTTAYLNLRRKISTISLYAFSIFALIAVLAIGGGGGVYNYDWGTVARYELSPMLLSWILVYYLALGYCCWLLFNARKSEPSPVTRRHIGYILASFIVFCVAQIKVSVTLGIDVAFTVPLGMLLTDSFGALIGIAIVKHQLFDVTNILKRGTIYSALAALIIFIFTLSEHLMATYLAGVAGGLSEYLHIISIAAVIVAFMPLKHRLDRIVGGYFAKKKIAVEF